MAMVCRRPHGTPGHSDVAVPQNIAWLAGFRLAQHSVFVQTPDFNAKPIVEACLDACRRGVECTIYVDLGYNDAGEMLPFQGGTNGKVIADMYDVLRKEGKQQFLKAYWYTAKDKDVPIDAAKKSRNCHIKFASFDGQVAVLGNGNQDAQSWYHSQEINVMVDSTEVIADWRAAIENNQNTAIHGMIDSSDGLYHDKQGNVIESSAGRGGALAWVKGVEGTIQRVRGVGGY